MSDDETDDERQPYEVGYGKPPVHSRFKAGQSGNPKGKPEGKKSYKSIVSAVLNEKVTVRTARGPKKMSKLEALIHTSMNNALKGDAKATDQVLKIAREAGLADEVTDAIDSATMKELSEEDRAILARFGSEPPALSGDDE